MSDTKPQYLSQFSSQSFDTLGKPGAINDIYNFS